ncbi:MAG: hypothetical protein RLZ45_2727 [Verrucomicrobiota bacterium]
MRSRRGGPTTGWLVALLGWLASVSALSEGYWESRLWRTFAAEQIPAALAFDTSGRVVLCAVGPRTFVGGVDADVCRWDGQRWEPLLPSPAAQQILCLATQGDDILAGLSRGGLVRWNGSLWEPWHFATPATIAAIAVHGERIVVSGTFTNIGTVSATNAAVWTGSAWESLGSGAPATTKANLLVAGSTTFVLHEGLNQPRSLWRSDGGTWTEVPKAILGGAPARPKPVARHDIAGKSGAAIAWWDDTLVSAGFPTPGALFRLRSAGWEPWVLPATDASALGLAVQGDDLLVHGTFRIVEGSSTNTYSILRFDGSRWSPVLGHEAAPVRSLQVRGKELFAVGSHTNRALYQPTAQILWRHDGTRWTPLNAGLNAVGTSTANIVATVEGFAATLSTATGRKIVGIWDGGVWSGFQSATLVAAEGSSLWSPAQVTDPSSGRPTNVLSRRIDGSWRVVSDPYPISARRIAADSQQVLIAGLDLRESPWPWALWSWIDSQWRVLDPALPEGSVLTTNTPITALTLWKGNAVFAVTLPVGSQNLCILDSSSGRQRIGSFNGPIHTLVANHDRLLVGGQFTEVDGQPCPRLAEWTGSSWSPISGGVSSGSVRALALSEGGDLAVGGGFRHLNATNLMILRNGVWDTAPGRIWDGAVLGLAWNGNDLGVCGDFYTVGTCESLGFAVWHDGEARLRLEPVNPVDMQLRITGATPARFTVQSSHDLTTWNDWITGSFGNATPFLTLPPTSVDRRFLRVMPKP